MTTGIKITCDEMRYIALFESISGASVKDCIVDEAEARAIFIVNPGQVGIAIGKGGRNIHTLEKMTGKKHEIIEYSEDPVQFIKNALKPERRASTLFVEAVFRYPERKHHLVTQR